MIVYDLAHHKSPIAQWLDVQLAFWKVTGLTAARGSENTFSEHFDFRTLLHYLNVFALSLKHTIKSHSCYILYSNHYLLYATENFFRCYIAGISSHVSGGGGCKRIRVRIKGSYANQRLIVKSTLMLS